MGSYTCEEKAQSWSQIASVLEGIYYNSNLIDNTKRVHATIPSYQKRGVDLFMTHEE